MGVLQRFLVIVEEFFRSVCTALVGNQKFPFQLVDILLFEIFSKHCCGINGLRVKPIGVYTVHSSQHSIYIGISTIYTFHQVKPFRSLCNVQQVMAWSHLVFLAELESRIIHHTAEYPAELVSQLVDDVLVALFDRTQQFFIVPYLVVGQRENHFQILLEQFVFKGSVQTLGVDEDKHLVAPLRQELCQHPRIDVLVAPRVDKQHRRTLVIESLHRAPRQKRINLRPFTEYAVGEERLISESAALKELLEVLLQLVAKGHIVEHHPHTVAQERVFVAVLGHQQWR